MSDLPVPSNPAEQCFFTTPPISFYVAPSSGTDAYLPLDSHSPDDWLGIHLDHSQARDGQACDGNGLDVFCDTIKIVDYSFSDNVARRLNYHDAFTSSSDEDNAGDIEDGDNVDGENLDDEEAPEPRTFLHTAEPPMINVQKLNVLGDVLSDNLEDLDKESAEQPTYSVPPPGTEDTLSNCPVLEITQYTNDECITLCRPVVRIYIIYTYSYDTETGEVCRWYQVYGTNKKDHDVRTTKEDEMLVYSLQIPNLKALREFIRFAIDDSEGSVGVSLFAMSGLSTNFEKNTFDMFDSPSSVFRRSKVQSYFQALDRSQRGSFNEDALLGDESIEQILKMFRKLK